MPVRLAKIYTKTGDKGSTKLASGQSIAKNHPRIDTYGSVDELNSFLGLLRDLAQENDLPEPYLAQLLEIQQELFDLGGELSFPPHDPYLEKLPTRILPVNTARLESEIDAMNAKLPPLANFVLPGGDQIASMAHICRTLTRKAERCLVHLASLEHCRADLLCYLNRLSDWFFVFSRAVIQERQKEEILWDQQRSTPSPKA